MDALHRSLTHLEQIAAVAVVVDAKDEAAVNFHRHFDFLPRRRNARRMYLPMTLVAARCISAIVGGLGIADTADRRDFTLL